MRYDEVILVDESDRPVGTMEKLEAHRQGLLHRAISVFVFNDRGELLLQRRAPGKYHSPGLWTNTCCSHPAPGEATAFAAARRLKEEMGLECPLAFHSSFIYKTHFENGLTEHELDHIYTGVCNETPAPDPNEADNYRWESMENIREDIRLHPEAYTSWFRIILENEFK